MTETRFTPNPVRLFLARVVYWMLWGPAVAAALPFAAIGQFVDFLSWRLFPKLAKAVRPAWGLAHTVALRCGNTVLGLPKQHDGPA